MLKIVLVSTKKIKYMHYAAVDMNSMPIQKLGLICIAFRHYNNNKSHGDDYL